jgi:hypothetical protein
LTISQKRKRKKWDPKSRETIMVEYCEDSKAYRLIDPGNPRNVQKERNVVFIEDYRCPTKDQEFTFWEEEILVQPPCKTEDEEIIQED